MSLPVENEANKQTGYWPALPVKVELLNDFVVDFREIRSSESLCSLQVTCRLWQFTAGGLAAV